MLAMVGFRVVTSPARCPPAALQEIYVNEFSSIVPEYACEQFAAQVDANGRVWEVVLQVNPYHPQLPGLRMRPRGPKEVSASLPACPYHEG